VLFRSEQQEPRNNIMEMAREGLRSPLTVALHQAVERNEVVVREAVRVKTNDHYTTADLQVTPIEDPEAIRGLYLITLTRVHEYVPEKSASEGARPDKPVPPGRVEEVERELRYARESHQTAMEEVQTTNEELQSSNEELQSSNEELQSSKEEMESLNEELSTVNNELNSKVEALARTRDDMRNLLNSTDLAVIFVDEQLQVKRYTDSARPLVNLRDSDVGRPLADLTVRLQYDDVLNDCREVLDTLVRKEKEVTTTDGSWLLMRVLPYRSSENVIGGVVITFVDITRLKYAEQQAEYFNSIVSTVREPLLVLDADLRVVSANK